MVKGLGGVCGRQPAAMLSLCGQLGEGRFAGQNRSDICAVAQPCPVRAVEFSGSGGGGFPICVVCDALRRLTLCMSLTFHRAGV